MNGSARGLMAFWADIEPAYLARFLEWHNCEHMPERVSIPGFREGRRYHGLGDAPAFLMLYHTDSVAVLGGEAYLARLNAPTAWTKESLPHFRNPSRNVYGERAAVGAADLLIAPYLAAIRFDIAPAAGDAALAAIETRLLAQWLAIDGVAAVRLYAIDDAVSGIETAERGLYGGGPGRQRFLLFADCARPEIAAGEAWRAAWDAVAGGGAVRNALPEMFWIDYALAKA